MRLPEPAVLQSPPDAAFHAAWLALVDALANAFQALREPDCARLVGPVVTGATMTFGARVPGTTYQLDPVQAAFCTGTLFAWPCRDQARPAPSTAPLSDTLGAVLAVADFLARRALADAHRPPTVRDLLAAALEAQARQHLAQARARAGHPGGAGVSAARVAIAEITTAAFGGSRAQIAHAARWAAAPGATAVTVEPVRWAAGMTCGEGVRLGLLAAATAAEDQGLAGPDAAAHVAVRETSQRSWEAVAARPDAVTAVRQRLDTAVAVHFPAAQAAKLAALLADRARLEALPINELVSLTVRN